MTTNVKIYRTRREAIGHEIFPFVTGWEEDFDLTHLEDSLLTREYDDDGRFIGFSFAQVTEEEFNEVMAEAMEWAGW